MNLAIVFYFALVFSVISLYIISVDLIVFAKTQKWPENRNSSAIAILITQILWAIIYYNS